MAGPTGPNDYPLPCPVRLQPTADAQPPPCDSGKRKARSESCPDQMPPLVFVDQFGVQASDIGEEVSAVAYEYTEERQCRANRQEEYKRRWNMIMSRQKVAKSGRRRCSAQERIFKD